MRMFFPLVLAALCCAPALTACDSREGETVESAYVLPPYPDPSYAFKRNGTSSVDYLECNLLSEPLDHIYESCLLYTSPSPRDPKTSRMPSSA